HCSRLAPLAPACRAPSPGSPLFNLHPGTSRVSPLPPRLLTLEAINGFGGVGRALPSAGHCPSNPLHPLALNGLNSSTAPRARAPGHPGMTARPLTRGAEAEPLLGSPQAFDSIHWEQAGQQLLAPQ